MSVILEITSRNGQVIGSAKQGDEIVSFVDPILIGNRLRWSQRVTKPMRLNLKFEVTVDGDHIVGTAKAGLLPASKVEAKRI